MNKKDAEQYVAFIADDAMSFRRPKDLPCDKPTCLDWLIGWKCKPNLLFVRVRSYIPKVLLDENEATELAIDGLLELNWFPDTDQTKPDYVFKPEDN